MDADLLPELSGETWVASALLDELKGDLQPAGVNGDLVSATSEDKMLQTVRLWVKSGKAPRGQNASDWLRSSVVGDYRLGI